MCHSRLHLSHELVPQLNDSVESNHILVPLFSVVLA